MSYAKQNWRQKWTDAKKKAKLKDSLFKQRLGPNLDELETLHGQLVKADAKAFPPLWKKAGTLSVRIVNALKAYRPMVEANVANERLRAQTLQVLSDIDAKGVFPMSAERNAKHHLLGLDRDDF
jgi:hypothetical protein